MRPRRHRTIPVSSGCSARAPRGSSSFRSTPGISAAPSAGAGPPSARRRASSGPDDPGDGTQAAPARCLRSFGRLTAKSAAHAPWTWRLLRGPVRRLFDSLAPGWDERTDADSERAACADRGGARALEREPLSRALDIGTGTGTGAFFLASRYPDAEVTGIDLSEAMIAKAKEKAAARGASRPVRGRGHRELRSRASRSTSY